MKSLEYILQNLEEISNLCHEMLYKKVKVRFFIQLFILLKTIVSAISSWFMMGIIVILLFLWFASIMYLLVKILEYYEYIEFMPIILFGLSIPTVLLCSKVFWWIENKNYQCVIALKQAIKGFSYFNVEKDDFFKKYISLPKEIISFNSEISKKLEDQENFWRIFEITSDILNFMENISNQKSKISIYFTKEYNDKITKIILQEIQLLQNILEYSFYHQIQKHNTIISEISNLQNNEWKHFSEILELQKTRLENQKKIFEKILGK